MSISVPGDGKIRVDVAEAISEMERLLSVYEDKRAAGGAGAEESFFDFKEGLRKAYRLMTRKKNHKGQVKAKNEATIPGSQKAIDALNRIAALLKKTDTTGFPDIEAELDPMDGDVAEMLKSCRDCMKDANRIQTAKGVRA